MTTRPRLRSRSPAVSLLVPALALLVLACGGDGGNEPAPVPQALAIVAGDSQAAVRGGELDVPLRVRVIGSDGEPLAGTTVMWHVVAGAGTLSPVQSESDGGGIAETRMTVVGSIGTVLASATVAGVPPAIFTLAGLDPCDFQFAPELTLGATRTGALSTLDCIAHGDRAHDLYLFSLPTSRAVTISTRATGFDPVFELYSAEPWFWLHPDTVNATRDARMKFILPAGLYGFVATSADEGVTGPYTARIEEAVANPVACELVLVFANTQSTHDLATSDCPGIDTRREDQFMIVLTPGETITITQTSTAFTPALRLLLDGMVVAESPAASGGTATLTYTSDVFALHRIHASSAQAAQGAYGLSVVRSGFVPSGASVTMLPHPRELEARAPRGHEPTTRAIRR